MDILGLSLSLYGNRVRQSYSAMLSFGGGGAVKHLGMNSSGECAAGNAAPLEWVNAVLI